MNTVTPVAAEAATTVAEVHPGRLASFLVIFAAGADWTKRLVVLCGVVEAGRLPFLIWDAILFQRADTVGAAWRAVEGWLNCWTCDPATDFPGHAARREGPAAADRLAGARWARRGGDQGWPHRHDDPPLTPLHQSIEVAL